MRLPALRSAVTISRSVRTRWPSRSRRAATEAVAQEWTRLANEGLGVGSSWRQTARRPGRVQRTIRPLLPIPGSTSTSPASRSRRSRAAVTARAVPAHIATASLDTTPWRAMNSNTSRSLWLILSLLFPGICFRDVAAAPADTRSRFASRWDLPDDAADHVRITSCVCVVGCVQRAQSHLGGEAAADAQSGRLSGGTSVARRSCLDCNTQAMSNSDVLDAFIAALAAQDRQRAEVLQRECEATQV